MQHQPAVVPAELAMPNSRSPASSKANSPRRARRIQAQPCVVELHQGATRIVHQADGSIVCEPVDTRGRSAPTSPKGLSGSKLGGAHLHELRDRVVNVAADCAIVVSGIGAVLGGMVGLFRSMDAMFNMEGGAEPHAVIQAAKTAVQGVALGTLTGAVVAPGTLVVGSLLGVATLARMAVRPALLGVAVHQGVRWVRRHQLGAAAIIRKLQSGDLVKQLEALRRLVARLNASLAFTTQFKRLAGVEVLLGLLERALAAAEAGASALVGPTASLSARALAELSKQGDVTDTIAELDGIPLLVRAAAMGLRGATAPTSPSAAGLAASGSPSARSTPSMQAVLDSQQGNAALLVHAMTALSRVTANHAVAQQILTSEPGVPHLVVNALDAATSRSVRGATPAACDELRAQAVTLVQALALEPSTKVELGAAGGVEALSAAFVTAQPWTQGQACAAAALHALVRGEPANQRRLAAVAPAGLSAAINRALVTGAGAVTGIASNGALTPGGSTGSGSLPLGGVLSAPVPSQDCHAHRADLLALSNVIARYTAPAPSSPVRAAPAVTAPAPAEAAKPAPTTFLQRLRLRPARATPPARAPAPKPGPAAPTKPAPATGAAAADAPATGTPVTGPALGAVVPDPTAEPAAVLGAPVAAVAALAEEDMGVLLHHLMQVNPGAEPSTAAAGVSEGGEADAASSGDQDQDWEKDMEATASPLKEEPMQPTGQQAGEAAEAGSA